MDDARDAGYAGNIGQIWLNVEARTDGDGIAVPFLQLVVFVVDDSMPERTAAFYLYDASIEVYVRPKVETRAVALEILDVSCGTEEIVCTGVSKVGKGG